MDGHPSGPLVTPCQIVRDPTDIARECRIDTTHGDEDPRIHQSGHITLCRRRDADNEPSRNDAHQPEDVWGPLARPVREPRDHHGKYSCRDVDWHREQLGSRRRVPQLVDDGGQEQRGAVQRADNAPVHPQTQVYLPISERIHDILPPESLLFSNQLSTFLTALIPQPMDHPLVLLRRQERRRLGEVINSEVRHNRHDHGQDAFKDEDPPPALIPAHTIHLRDPVGEDTAERAGHARRREEHGLPQLGLAPDIPHGDIVRYTGVQPSLGHAQEEPRCEQALEVRDDAHEGHDSAPSNHDGGQPDGRAEAFEEEVGRHLEDAVGEEEDGEGPVVLGAGHVEVFLQTFDLCVADVAAIEKGEEVEEGEHGDEVEVHLPKGARWVDCARRRRRDVARWW